MYSTSRNTGFATQACLRAAFLAAAAFPLLATTVRADDNTQTIQVATSPKGAAFVLDDNDPERSVPTMEDAMKRPLQMGYLVMELIDRGRSAMEREDPKAAVKYYRALIKAVPERGTAYALLCKGYVALGDSASALDACRTALGKQGVTVEDNVRFVELLLQKDGVLEKKDIEDIDAVIAHLSTELAASPEQSLLVPQLQCSVATRVEDVQRLEQCSAKLREIAPKDPRSIAYAFALFLKKQDFVAAETLVREAERLGLPLEATDKMQSALRRVREQKSSWQLWLEDWGLIGGLTFVLTALAGIFVFWRRRAPLASGSATPAT